jgi:hypothetical protein
VVFSNRSHTQQSYAAHHAAQRHHYYQPRQATYIRPPQVVRVGPAFALVVPVQFTVETHAPDSGPHEQPRPGESVESVTGIVLMLAVIVFLVGRVVMRFVDAAGNVFSLDSE